MGLEESHMEPAGRTKKGEQRGVEKTSAFAPALRGPQHLLPVVQQQTTPGMPAAAKGSAVGGLQETSTTTFISQATITLFPQK